MELKHHFDLDFAALPRFARQVFEILSPLQTGGFIPAVLLASERFASLVKRLSDDVCACLVIKDGRPANADLGIALWIAPTDAPDDGFERLFVGYKIVLGSTFDVGDDFFEKCAVRVSNLFPAMPAICEVVERELERPAFETRRLVAYRHERRAYGSLLGAFREPGNAIARSASDIAARASMAQASFDDLEGASAALARALIESGSLGDEVCAFYQGDVKRLGSALFRHLYVDALTAPERFQGETGTDRRGPLSTRT